MLIFKPKSYLHHKNLSKRESKTKDLGNERAS